MPGVIESRHGSLLLALVSPKAHAHVGMPQVGPNLHIGNIHARQAWVPHFKTDKLRQLFANRFRYPLSAMLIHMEWNCRTQVARRVAKS